MRIPRLLAIPLMIAALAAHADVISPSDMQPESAAAQRVRLAEVSAVIPTGCTPTGSRKGATQTLTCAWPTEGGVTRTYVMSRTEATDSELLSETRGMSRADRDRLLTYAMPAYLTGITTFPIDQGELPSYLALPAGYRLREVYSSEMPDPGPHGMYGYCMVVGYIAEKAANEVHAMGLYCAAAGEDPYKLLIVTSMLLAEHPRTVRLDSRFTAEAERTAGNLTIDW
jgi:hypothetical protein